MFGTVISIILALGIYFIPESAGLIPDIKSFTTVLLIIPPLLVLFQMLVLALAFLPLQKAEQNLTPRILELFKKDMHFKLVNVGIILLALLSIFCTFDNTLLKKVHPSFPLITWIVFLGISFDLFHHLIRRMYSYINPFEVTQMFTKAAKQSIEKDRELDLCNWIESLSEVGVKSLHRSSTSLCNSTLEELREILRLFIESSKSIAHETQDAQSQALGITDKVSFTLFYSFGRIEYIFQKALDLSLDPVCSAVISTLGKITIYAAKYDLSLATYPIHYLGKFSLQAEEKKMPEVALKGSCTLLEVSKVILNEIDVTYMDLKDPFLSIISHLDSIAKETFRKDKKSSIAVLTQPFKDLKELFNAGKIAQHQDTPVIVGQIDKVLAEWETLETVLRTMPPIPPIPSVDVEPK